MIAAMFAGVRPDASMAQIIAPADVPEVSVGRIPASSSARVIPA
jgi:hypothetical protein